MRHIGNRRAKGGILHGRENFDREKERNDGTIRHYFTVYTCAGRNHCRERESRAGHRWNGSNRSGFDTLGRIESTETAGSARVDFVRQICGHFERGRILLRESFLYQCESGS